MPMLQVTYPINPAPPAVDEPPVLSSFARLFSADPAVAGRRIAADYHELAANPSPRNRRLAAILHAEYDQVCAQFGPVDGPLPAYPSVELADVDADVVEASLVAV